MAAGLKLFPRRTTRTHTFFVHYRDGIVRQWTLENFSGTLNFDEIHQDHLTARQGRQLSQMFEYLPELRRLRQFVLHMHRLFDPRRSFRYAANQWASLVTTPACLADPDLARPLAMLTEEKFEKMSAYLDSPQGKRVRINNHVERTNRMLRYLEKVRYKWRRRRTIVRFVVLAFDSWKKQADLGSVSPSKRFIADVSEFFKRKGVSGRRA
jgi:hypothetical protein